MKTVGSYPKTRLRRLRKSKWLRNLVSENNISNNDLVLPIFIREGKNKIEQIKSMPGVNRYSVDKLYTVLNEVRKFNKLRVKKDLSANKLIGVKEINDFLSKSISLEQCKELINIKTRQYAKRQNTWARGHMKNWNKLYSKNFSNLLKKSLKVVS